MNVSTLVPLPYHREVVAYLRAREPELWEWFSSTRAHDDHAESMRLELLKSTYRLDPTAHPDLHDVLGEVVERLSIDVPVTVYQAQTAGEGGTNASLYYCPGEAHVVLSGAVLDRLGEDELRALLGHELAHYRLWELDDHVFRIADQILTTIAVDPRAEPSHVTTCRRFRLYTEIFADRAGALAAGGIETIISCLVKVETGLSQVSPRSYIAQADEIFARSKIKTEGVSHPETFIRARALALLELREQRSTEHATGESAAGSDESLEAEIARMIEGEPALDELDLPAQERLEALTREFVSRFLAPSWFRGESISGQARLLFDDIELGTLPESGSFPDALRFEDRGLQDYLSYLMLDFIAVDPDVRDRALDHGFVVSDELGIEKRFDAIVARELKLKKKDVSKKRAAALAAIGAAGATGEKGEAK